MLAATTAAAGLAIVFQFSNLASSPAVALLFLSACFAQLVVASCGGIMGSLRSEDNRRRASGFYQAGSLAFGAVGIFVVASLAGRMKQGELGWIVAATIALPSLVALASPKQDVLISTGAGEILRRIGREFAVPSSAGRQFPMRR